MEGVLLALVMLSGSASVIDGNYSTCERTFEVTVSAGDDTVIDRLVVWGNALFGPQPRTFTVMAYDDGLHLLGDRGLDFPVSDLTRRYAVHLPSADWIRITTGDAYICEIEAYEGGVSSLEVMAFDWPVLVGWINDIVASDVVKGFMYTFGGILMAGAIISVLRGLGKSPRAGRW